MTDELWDSLAERVAMSRFTGVTSDDDDILHAADLTEGAINPHQGAGGAAGGTGAPAMMMPPMMMGGGMGRGGAPGGGGGGMGTPAPPGPMGPPATGPMASGYDPLMAAPKAAGTASAGAGDAAADGGSAGSGGTGAGDASGSAGGAGSAGGTDPESGSDSGGGTASPTGPTKTGGATGGRHDGFAFDPEVLKKLADRWTELARDFPAMPPPGELSMGLLTGAERPRQALTQQLSLWAAGSTTEFEEIAARLRDTDTAYQDVDDEGAAQIRKATS